MSRGFASILAPLCLIKQTYYTQKMKRIGISLVLVAFLGLLTQSLQAQVKKQWEAAFGLGSIDRVHISLRKQVYKVGKFGFTAGGVPGRPYYKYTTTQEAILSFEHLLYPFGMQKQVALYLRQAGSYIYTRTLRRNQSDYWSKYLLATARGSPPGQR